LGGQKYQKQKINDGIQLEAWHENAIHIQSTKRLQKKELKNTGRHLHLSLYT